MTIGRNNEAPAAYALTSTIKRLLDHLMEVDLYSEKDLTHVSHTLEKLRETIKNSDKTYSEKLITLLSNRIELCQVSLSNLQSRLNRLGGELPAIYEKLISILRSISLANTRTKVGSMRNIAFLRMF
jgi:CII-binding regulator of phage lambda lysogenization HflD